MGLKMRRCRRSYGTAAAAVLPGVWLARGLTVGPYETVSSTWTNLQLPALCHHATTTTFGLTQGSGMETAGYPPVNGVKTTIASRGCSVGLLSNRSIHPPLLV